MPTTRSQSKKFEADQIQALGQGSMQDSHEPMIEWLVFDYSETVTGKKVDWKDLLNEIQAVQGCRYINFACPMETPQKLWIIIQWLSGSWRDNFHRADKIAGKAKNFLYQQSEHIYSSHRIDYLFGKMISGLNPLIYEVWMVYFPIEALEAGKRKESQMPRLMNFYERDEEPHNPMSGILSQHIVWLSGETIYQGMQCQRLAWFLEWRSKEAEELYKTKGYWDWEGEGKNRKPKLLLKTFIDNLKSLGMVGYETWHAQFVNIQAPLGI